MNRLLLGCLLALASNVALAHASVNLRQHHQFLHIDEGVHHGDLTRSEARMLHAQMRSIRAEERFFLRDGKLSRRERRELNRDLTRLNREIYRQRYDSDRR